MNKSKRQTADRLYLILAGLFITSLVTCNLIFTKFFSWQPLPEVTDFTFVLSVGILAYPVTFLVTDIISEFYGQKKADRVVVAGLLASAFMLGIVYVADAIPASEVSIVSDSMFNKVFGLSGIAVASSLIAYLTAQMIDIRIYHFWKRATKGRHLWIRNNFSTMLSQLVDSTVIITLLTASGKFEWSQWAILVLSGWLFKVMCAALDTPIIYLVAWRMRKHFDLQPGQELNY